ncbi:uncharacterized protein LOC118437913 [Folsomia candida]|uniref:uncharacterized protein LOC118437913 n=1 Tax=Folsomia candida TaxID=158441 RepID=UPI001604AB0C|nr:uncharacterized protein LOC118437913 [Folsomia candida]
MAFFEEGAIFKQFLHCKFRDNIVRLLHLGRKDVDILLGVTKFGQVGLYDGANNMSLVTTFCLDMEYEDSVRKLYGRRDAVRPKCKRSHVVVDAVLAENIQCVIFATTKGMLQCYDNGELDGEDLGLHIFPRSKFLHLSKGRSPISPRNLGLVETFRVHGLYSVPSCLCYHRGGRDDAEGAKLLVGHVDGTVTIIELGLEGNKYPFGDGKRKLRGVINHIDLSRQRHKIRSYRGHCDPGVNTVAHSDLGNKIITGSEDGVIRIFSEFSMKMPQMELSGHKGAVIGLALLSVPFSSGGEILLSYSEDVELRAWDPDTFTCLQNIYVRFPCAALSSTIICKTPQFAKNPILLLSTKSSSEKEDTSVILLYCNSYAKFAIYHDNPASTAAWPFNNLDLEDIDSYAKSKPRVTASLKKTGRRNYLGDEQSDSSTLQEIATDTMSALMRHKYSAHHGRPGGKKSLTAVATRRLASLQISSDHVNRNAKIFDKLTYHELQPVVKWTLQEPKYYTDCFRDD